MMNFNTFTIPVNQYTEDFGSEKLAIEQFGFPAENPDRLLFLVNAHAVGFSKETYRPLLVRLGERLRELKEYENTSISFLTMDSRYHGDSSILNKQRASKNYRWVDNAADIRQLVEYLKLKKKGTVIGIGHSWGASCIVLCEKVFSNTFDGLILMDVGMCIEPLPLVKRLKDTMYISFYRKDTWPDRQSFKKSIEKNPFWSSFDPKAVELYSMYCAYETEEGTVRLKCSKDHENRIVMHSSLECVIAERIFQKNSVPTLCIFGRHSFVIDEPGVLTSIKSNPQNKLVYAKGGHMFPLENIEDASLQIVKYLPYVDQKRLISKL